MIFDILEFLENLRTPFPSAEETARRNAKSRAEFEPYADPDLPWAGQRQVFAEFRKFIEVKLEDQAENLDRHLQRIRDTLSARLEASVRNVPERVEVGAAAWPYPLAKGQAAPETPHAFSAMMARDTLRRTLEASQHSFGQQIDRMIEDAREQAARYGQSIDAAVEEQMGRTALTEFHVAMAKHFDFRKAGAAAKRAVDAVAASHVAELEEARGEWAEAYFEDVRQQQLAFIAEHYDIAPAAYREAPDEAYLAQAAPALALYRARLPAFPLPRSRRGGLPHLPAGAEWPSGVDGTPLHFLMQVDLAECADVPVALPQRGTLLFFADLSRASSFGGGAVIFDAQSAGTERAKPDTLAGIGAKRLGYRPAFIETVTDPAVLSLIGLQYRPITTLPFPATFPSDAETDPLHAANYHAFHAAMRDACPDPGSTGTGYYIPSEPASVPKIWRVVQLLSMQLASVYKDRLGEQFAEWAEKAAGHAPHGMLTDEEVSAFGEWHAEAARRDEAEAYKDYGAQFHFGNVSTSAWNQTLLEAESDPVLADALAPMRKAPDTRRKGMATQFSQMLGHGWAPGGDEHFDEERILLLQAIPDWGFGIIDEIRFMIAPDDLADRKFGKVTVTRHERFTRPVMRLP